MKPIKVTKDTVTITLEEYNALRIMESTMRCAIKEDRVLSNWEKEIVAHALLHLGRGWYNGYSG